MAVWLIDEATQLRARSRRGRDLLKYNRKDMALAVAASALAGYVDAVGFLSLGGFFVSFMSGNSTRLAVGLLRLPAEALVSASLIGAFLLGVIGGSLCGRAAGRRRKPATLGLVAFALSLSAILPVMGELHPAAMLAAAAMGAENTVFERDGEVSIGLTYMTGTLVKLGQRLATMMCAGSKTAWMPYASLWVGLVVGSTTGAMAFAWIGFEALGMAAAFAAVLAIVACLAGL